MNESDCNGAARPSFLDEGQKGPRSKQDEERDGQIHRAQDAGFDLPPVMNDSADCGEVDELVEAIPLLAAEFANGPGGGCGCERDEQGVCGESGDDEAALGDVGLEDVPIEVEIEGDDRWRGGASRRRRRKGRAGAGT